MLWIIERLDHHWMARIAHFLSDLLKFATRSRMFLLRFIQAPKPSA